MARSAAQGISKHKTKGYRLCLGKKPGGGYRTFWLGQHRAIAEYAAYMFRERYGFMRDQGREIWTKQDEDAVWEWVEMHRIHTSKMWDLHQRDVQKVEEQGRIFTAALGDDPQCSPPSTVGATENEKPKTLYRAIDAYLEALKSKRKSESHRWRAEQVVKVNLKRIRGDCSMQSIDFAWLDALADYYKSRPLSNKGKRKNRKPISAQTVKTTLSYLRQFFVWCDDVSFGGWQGPRKLTKPFRVRLDDLKTQAELKQSQHIEQFDIPTLVCLYRAGSKFQKTIMLTALFTGATQQELAVLEKKEFDLELGILHHFRNKTGVEGRFWLPPELVTLLRNIFRQHRRKALAFYTSTGSSLLTFKDGKLTSDAVRQSWTDLRNSAKLPNALSFKFLRKFLADWMTRNGGDALGQIALSHARQTVLAKHYTTARDFELFFELQRQMYEELKTAEMFQTEVKKSECATGSSGGVESEAA